MVPDDWPKDEGHTVIQCYSSSHTQRSAWGPSKDYRFLCRHFLSRISEGHDQARPARYDIKSGEGVERRHLFGERWTQGSLGVHENLWPWSQRKGFDQYDDCIEMVLWELRMGCWVLKPSSKAGAKTSHSGDSIRKRMIQSQQLNSVHLAKSLLTAALWKAHTFTFTPKSTSEPNLGAHEKAKSSENGKSSCWIETKKNGKCTSFIAAVRIIEILVGFYLAVQVSPSILLFYLFCNGI